jgi:hypothetical protein
MRDGSAQVFRMFRSAKGEHLDRRAGQPARQALVAVVLVLGAGLGWWGALRKPTGRLDTLGQRGVQPSLVRLSGLLEAEPIAGVRGSSDAARRRDPVVGDGEPAISGDPSAQSLHAFGVSLLRAGRLPKAVVVLRRAARGAETNAAIANDLGAALIQSGTAERSAALIAEGLDVLLRAGDDEHAPELLYNRALALEGLGLRRLAVAAWKSYLALDAGSPWDPVARARLVALRDLPPPSDSANAEELEREVLERQLPRWAEASLRGSRDEALAIVEAAAETASRYAEATGDRWLLDATTLVRTASGTATTAVAEGHRAYALARRLYATEDVTGCRREAAHAGNLLARADSPVAALAVLTNASCDFLANDLAAASRHVATAKRLVNRPAPQSKLIGGQIAWLEGLVAHAQNHPLESIAAYDAALADFRARDPQREAVIHALLSDLYDYLGRADDAWNEGVQAARNERLSPRRRYIALRSLTELARREGFGHLALFLARSTRNDVARSGLGSYLCESYLDEGRAAESVDDREGAIQAFEAGLQAAQAIPDTTARGRSLAHASVELARALVTTEPERAEALLASAVALAAGDGDFYVATAQVHADAVLARGNADDAEQILRAAIARSDRERRSFAALRERDELLDRRKELHYALVRLLADRGVAGPALDVLEEWRAEPFPDLAPATAVESQPPLEASTEWFAFLALDEELLVWRRSASGVELARSALRRDALADLVAAVGNELQQNAYPAAAARQLSRLLFGDGPRAHHLVIAPDDLLFAVPFGALPRADGRPLMAGSDIVVTPSTRLWASRSVTANGAPGCLLLIAGSPSGGRLYPRLATISNLDDEVQAVRDRYACSDEAASVDELESVRWGRYDVIHYAGHSVVGGANGGVLVLRAGASVVGVDGRAIEKLPLHEATVVLSSCSAADGRPSLIAGRDGLARAFLTAGARSVIASLWPVEDRDALELSGELHQRLAAGEGAAPALRAAQLALKGKGRPAQAWAAWRVIGAS